MRLEQFGIVTFESTHHAINGEKIFKENDILFKTIPTPREISLSCGLSIRFDLIYLDKVVELYTSNTLAISGVYSFTIIDEVRKIKKLV